MTTWFFFCYKDSSICFAGNSNLKSIPEGLQNLTEYITEFIRDLAKTQIGEEEYVKWVPF
jgi:F-type H+-transporting ATPase subunit a